MIRHHETIGNIYMMNAIAVLKTATVLLTGSAGALAGSGVLILNSDAFVQTHSAIYPA